VQAALVSFAQNAHGSLSLERVCPTHLERVCSECAQQTADAGNVFSSLEVLGVAV